MMRFSESNDAGFPPANSGIDLPNPAEAELAHGYGLLGATSRTKRDAVGSTFDNAASMPLVFDSKASSNRPLTNKLSLDLPISSKNEQLLHEHINETDYKKPSSKGDFILGSKKSRNDKSFNQTRQFSRSNDSLQRGSAARTVTGRRKIAIGYDGSGINATYRRTYNRSGGQKIVGLAVNRVHRWEDGYTQDFKGGSDGVGAIMKSNVNNRSYWVGGDFWQGYLESGGANGILGYPTSNRYRVGDGLVQNFKGGQILSSSQGTFAVYGGIGSQYLNYEGGPKGRLGYPKTTELGIGNRVIIQRFENGAIRYGDGVTKTIISGKKLAVGYDGNGVNSTYTETFNRTGGWDVVGSAVNNVHRWRDGYTQDFKGGSDGVGAIMKSNANNQSYWVGGDVWTAYLDSNGANGLLGYPTSDNYAAGSGIVQDFQGGQILSSSYGTFAVYGGVGFQYLNYEGGVEGRLGYPKSSELGKGNGVIVQKFEGGQILYGKGPTRTLLGNKEIAVGYDNRNVHSTYTSTFDRVGGWDVVGSAVNNVHRWKNGYTQDFKGGSDGVGAIMKSNANDNSYWVGGDIWSAYLKASGANGLLGYPTSDKYVIGDGVVQNFKGGQILSSSHGTFAVYGGIGSQYLNYEGGARGRLGYPKSAELGVGNDTIIQRFENGTIRYGDGVTRTVIGGKNLAVGFDGSGVNSTYTETFNRSGGWNVIGSAVNNVHRWENGYTQDFKGGSDDVGAIMKSNANNKSYWVGGDFWQGYLKAGGAKGILGYPTSDRYGVDGALRQNFQEGVIYQTFRGVFAVFGGIGDYFLKSGGERGLLGLPASKEVGIGKGRIRQNFENGYVLWNGGAIGYKHDGSRLFPISSGEGPSQGTAISYEKYLSLLYKDRNGGHITQTYEQHKNAIDSADNDSDRRVYALSGGQVKYIGKDQYGGNFVRVWSSELQRNFVYLHFASFNSNLRIGQSIRQGDYLGFEGTTGKSTGVHTHVHVTRSNGSRENPLVTLGRLKGYDGNQTDTFTPPEIPTPLNDIGREYSSNKSWLGLYAKESWKTADGQTSMVKFENGWIAKNNLTGRVESFANWYRPSWVTQSYVNALSGYLRQKELHETTWSTTAGKMLKKYEGFINLASLYYGVSGQAIAGIIRWEYEKNVISRLANKATYDDIQETGRWSSDSVSGGTGWGKINYNIARKIIKEEPSVAKWTNNDQGIDDRVLSRLLAIPATSIDLIARELRHAAKAYSKYRRVNIYDNPGVLATLYRIGETEISYEERARREPVGTEPTVESGIVSANFLRVEAMGSWVERLSDEGHLNNFEDLS